jgi:alanine racemase
LSTTPVNNTLRPTWAEIDLDSVAHNIREVRRVTPNCCLICAVVKADGYGHGAIEIADTLLKNGADRLAVAILSEAILLKRAYRQVEVMILGYTPPDLADFVVENQLVPTLYDLETAQAFSAAAMALGTPVKVHLKLDMGMGRIGMPPSQDSISQILRIGQLPGLEVEGVFTHFAVADEADKGPTLDQAGKFSSLVNSLKAAGLPIALKHVSNSAAIIDLPGLSMDMVRPGIMLYGIYPSDFVSHETVRLRETLSLKAKVSHVKEVPAGTGISYGYEYFTKTCEKIATLPIGYADGYCRSLGGGKASVLIHGRRAPIVGRICMDQCMVNVTGMGVEVGDTATLIGIDGDDSISVVDIARLLATNPHEVICGIGKRVPRVYWQGGRIVLTKEPVTIYEGGC